MGKPEPPELADGDFRCLGGALMKLWTDDGRDINSSRSELGVRLPKERLLGSLRCRDTGGIWSKLYDADGSNDGSNDPICADVIEDLFELTLLDRLDETDPRFALFPVFRLVGTLE